MEAEVEFLRDQGKDKAARRASTGCPLHQMCSAQNDLKIQSQG